MQLGSSREVLWVARRQRLLNSERDEGIRYVDLSVKTKAENPSNAGDRRDRKEVMSGGSERIKRCIWFKNPRRSRIRSSSNPAKSR